MASQAGHVEVVRLLLEAGAIKGDAQMPVLPIASASGHVAVVELLLEAAADKDQSDSLGLTPLSAAAHYGHVEIVRALLEAGADKDRGANFGLTPLQVAAAQGHLGIVRLLLPDCCFKPFPVGVSYSEAVSLMPLNWFPRQAKVGGRRLQGQERQPWAHRLMGGSAEGPRRRRAAAPGRRRRYGPEPRPRMALRVFVGASLVPMPFSEPKTYVCIFT